ncbi:hypothetical protein BH11PLA2_BH11PLA2_40700 [soil metagenome]
MEKYTLQTPDGERHYLVARPRHTTGPGPAVVFLHGTGGTAAWAAEEARLHEAAPAAGFTLVAPEAMRPDPTSVAKFLSNPPRWNDGSPAAVPELATDADDVGFLNAVLDDVVGKGFADPRRISLSGFSNGAGMAFRFAAHAADRLAAVAPIAGLWWNFGQTPSRPVPTMYLVGTHDPLIPLRGGTVRLPWGNKLLTRPPVMHSLESWAVALNCDPRSLIVRDNDGVREEVFPGATEFRVLTIAGLGHHWPGGQGQLNPRIAGPAAHAFELNPELFAFFRRHSREG